jgi:sucrose-6-phosphate hydrolase SacC (GH32 family)
MVLVSVVGGTFAAQVGRQGGEAPALADAPSSGRQAGGGARAGTAGGQTDVADITPDQSAVGRNYAHPLRPQFHYTPIQGHLGDATGLIYYKGEYHLFNMYDEWSRRRAAHKQWGHAISTDLVHWRQLPGVLDAQVDNRPGSGSGVVDWNNSSGLAAGDERTLLIFYTDYRAGTGVMFSRDRGRTWTHFAKNPVIAGSDDARDPTVFWYAPLNEWRMVRYEKRGFAFYRSTNLLQWEWLSRVDGYFECPDLIRLPIDNRPGQERWVLVDGDSSYVVGGFDGRTFTPETAKLQVDYGTALYAGQTWKRTLEGGPPAYQLFWMRYPMNTSIVWNGQMSFPVELGLWAFPEGIRLTRQPIDEINNLRVAHQQWRSVTIQPGQSVTPAIGGDLIDLVSDFDIRGGGTVGFSIRGQRLVYSAADRRLRLADNTAPLALPDGHLRLRLLIDRSSIEVFADRGQVTISRVTLDRGPQTGITVIAEGAPAHIVALDANQLESIWRETPIETGYSR